MVSLLLSASSRRARPVSATNASSRLACSTRSCRATIWWRASAEVTALSALSLPVTTTTSPLWMTLRHIGQAGQQPVVERHGRAELDPLPGLDPLGQPGRGVHGHDPARVDQRHPVAEPLGLLHEVGDEQDR